MAIKFRCVCGRILAVSDKFAGKKGKCPSCGRLLLIPTPKKQVSDNRPTVEMQRPQPGPMPQQPAPEMDFDDAPSPPVEAPAEAEAPQEEAASSRDSRRESRRDRSRGDRPERDRGDRASRRDRRSRRDKDEPPAEEPAPPEDDLSAPMPEPEPAPEPKKRIEIDEPDEKVKAAVKAEVKEADDFFSELDKTLEQPEEEKEEEPEELEPEPDEPEENKTEVKEKETKDPLASIDNTLEQMQDEIEEPVISKPKKEESPKAEEKDVKEEEEKKEEPAEDEESSEEKSKDEPSEEKEEKSEPEPEPEPAPKKPAFVLKKTNLIEGLPEPDSFEDAAKALRESLPEEDQPVILDESQKITDRYEIKTILGANEIFVEYTAIDSQEEDKTVVLKCARPSALKKPEIENIFTEEGIASLAIDAANAQNYESLENEGEIKYIVAEYVPGRSLELILRNFRENDKRIPAGNALQATKDILLCLDSLDQEDITEKFHGDIRPGNIIITEDGSARILGIGLASLKKKAGLLQLNKERLPYLPTEQLLPDAELNIVSDLYSAAVIFYEMLTGATPLGLFKPPTSICEGLVENIDHFMEKAFATEPEDRYQTAKEMLEALSEIEALATPEEPAEDDILDLSDLIAEESKKDGDGDESEGESKPAEENPYESASGTEDKPEEQKDRRGRARGDRGDRTPREKGKRREASPEAKKRNFMISMIMIGVTILCIIGLVYIIMTRVIGKDDKNKNKNNNQNKQESTDE